MPATTRSQTVRETVATSTAPAQDNPELGSENDYNAGLRRRTSEFASTNTSRTSLRSRSAPDEPPRFTIDLSLPPEQRYLEVCAAFQEEIHGLVPLFDEVVGEIARVIPLKWLKRLSRLLLRRVYDSEENRELKGISQATGVDMYLLVCFNVLLDLFMGCSSGGAAIRNEKGNGSKMVHFRTLDWGMPSLRQVVVQLDFKTEADGPVVASSITYAGYVGVLTGVRRDFSVSLNFRPSRNDKFKFWADVKYYWHLVMVLLGRRRSISSELRRFLLPSCQSSAWFWKSKGGKPWNFVPYADAVKEAGCQAGKALKTTACYLCFSNGNETTIMEKDRVTAVVRNSDEFIVVTNNDIDHEDEKTVNEESSSPFAMALAEIVEEAVDRRQCAEHNYHNMRVKKAKKREGVVDLKAVLEVDDIVEVSSSALPTVTPAS